MLTREKIQSKFYLDLIKNELCSDFSDCCSISKHHFRKINTKTPSADMQLIQL